MNKMLYSKYITQERRKRALTIGKLSEVSGVSRHTITKIENGGADIAPDTMKKLKEAFDKIEPIIPDDVELPQQMAV